MNLTVDHRHDTIPKLLVDYSFDGLSVYQDTLKIDVYQFRVMNKPNNALELRPRIDDREQDR